MNQEELIKKVDEMLQQKELWFIDALSTDGYRYVDTITTKGFKSKEIQGGYIEGNELMDEALTIGKTYRLKLGSSTVFTAKYRGMYRLSKKQKMMIDDVDEYNFFRFDNRINVFSQGRSLLITTICTTRECIEVETKRRND